jgi:hypothetical protein
MVHLYPASFLLVLAALVRADPVTMYKLISEERCGETNIDQSNMEKAEEFGGLRIGSCLDKGFSMEDGSQTQMNIAFVGDVTLRHMKMSPMAAAVLQTQQYVAQFLSSSYRSLFGSASHLRGSKAKPAAVTSQASQAQVEAQHQGDAEPLLHHWKPAAFQNDLLEGSPQAELDALDSRAASLSVFQPPKGFNHIIPSPPDVLSSSVSGLYKISDSGNSCAEPHIGEVFKAAAIQFANMKEGNCAQQGFTVEKGVKSINVPVLGPMIVTKYNLPTRVIATAQ